MLNPFSDIGSGQKFGSEGQKLKNHMSLSNSKRLLGERGEDPEAYYYFSSIRNPWDKMVSRYHFGLRNPGSVWHARAVSAGSFGAFIRDESIQDAALNTEFQALFWENGAYALDDMVMVENFDADIGRIWSRLGLPPAKLRHTNRNMDRPKDYRDYYDDETIEVVGKLFSREIGAFGYRF